MIKNKFLVLFAYIVMCNVCCIVHGANDLNIIKQQLEALGKRVDKLEKTVVAQATTIKNQQTKIDNLNKQLQQALNNTQTVLNNCCCSTANNNSTIGEDKTVYRELVNHQIQEPLNFNTEYFSQFPNYQLKNCRNASPCQIMCSLDAKCALYVVDLEKAVCYFYNEKAGKFVYNRTSSNGNDNRIKSRLFQKRVNKYILT